MVDPGFPVRVSQISLRILPKWPHDKNLTITARIFGRIGLMDVGKKQEQKLPARAYALVDPSAHPTKGPGSVVLTYKMF